MGMRGVRVDGAGGLVTLQAAAQALDKTYWQVRYYIKRNGVPTVTIGNTVLLRLRDLSGLR